MQAPATGTPQYFVFTDASGAEYRLDPIASGVYASHEGTYLWYEPGTQKVHFADGSWWTMLALSAAGESDAGTRYPTAMYDTNGNYLTIEYQTGSGGSAVNTSARIQKIRDSRAGYYDTYLMTYNNDATPHLVSIAGVVGDSYSFTWLATTVSAPFGTETWSSTLMAGVEGGVSTRQFTAGKWRRR